MNPILHRYKHGMYDHHPSCGYLVQLAWPSELWTTSRGSDKNRERGIGEGEIKLSLFSNCVGPVVARLVACSLFVDDLYFRRYIQYVNILLLIWPGLSTIHPPIFPSLASIRYRILMARLGIGNGRSSPRDDTIFHPFRYITHTLTTDNKPAPRHTRPSSHVNPHRVRLPPPQNCMHDRLEAVMGS